MIESKVNDIPSTFDFGYGTKKLSIFFPSVDNFIFAFWLYVKHPSLFSYYKTKQTKQNLQPTYNGHLVTYPRTHSTSLTFYNTYAVGSIHTVIKEGLD